MRPTRFCTRLACFAFGCLVAMLLTALSARGNTIDVRLNVTYTSPAEPELSGGTWSLEAKSGGAGILSLSLRLEDIAAVTTLAPAGVVNGNQEAGFAIFQDAVFGDHRNIFVGQRPHLPNTLFYGLGTLANGSPDYPGKPVGSNSIGPMMPTLTNVTNVPWASDPPDPLDMDWDLAATLLTGTFNVGQMPNFFTAEGIVSTGNVFTSVGSSSVAGTILNLDPLTSMIVRTNLPTMMADADYNNDGFVNAADYTVWRNTVGSTTVFDADGSGPSGVPDQVIDMFDYQFWKDHYGETVPGSGAVTGNLDVPEPATAWLLVFGAILTFRRARFGSTEISVAGRGPAKNVKRDFPQ